MSDVPTQRGHGLGGTLQHRLLRALNAARRTGEVQAFGRKVARAVHEVQGKATRTKRQVTLDAKLCCDHCRK